MKQPLIIGYGRAGKRHDEILKARGFLPAIVEPEVSQLSGESRRHFFNLVSALSADDWAFAVICTPPEQHRQDLLNCLEAGLPVLCEKPLCGFGELPFFQPILSRYGDAKAMVAYNYRFHPDLTQAYFAHRMVGSNEIRSFGYNRAVQLFASQHRAEIPPWGLMLDHVSHDLDTLTWKFGPLCVETARTYESPSKVAVRVFGTFHTVEGSFSVHDEVRKSPCDRVAWIFDGIYKTEISSTPEMFENLYNRFFAALEGKDTFWPGLKEAIETQEALEDANYFATEGGMRKVTNVGN